MSKFEIIRDTREKTDHGWWFGEDSRCVGTVVEKLDYGDYSIKGLETKLAIERKASTAEIANNILEDRFYRELVQLSEFKYAYILLEFSWDDIRVYPERSGIPKRRWDKLRITGNFIMRKLHLIRIKYGVHIIACGTPEKARDEAYLIMRYIHELECGK